MTYKIKEEWIEKKKLADVLAQPPRFVLPSITSRWVVVRDDRNDGDNIVVVFVGRGQIFFAEQ